MASAEQGPSLRQRVATVVRARLLTSLVDAATGILLVRTLPKAEFAVLMLLLVVHETLKQIATLGLPESVLYFAERWGASRHRALAWRTSAMIAGHAALSGTIMLGMAFTTDLWLASWELAPRAQVARYLPWIAAMSLCELPTWPTTNVLIGTGKTAQAGAYEVTTSLLLLAAILTPAILGFGLPGIATGLVLYGVSRLVISAAWLLRCLPSRGQVGLPQGSLRKQFRFAAPLGLSALSSRVNKYIDRTVVAVMLPALAFADYTAATTEVPFLNVFPHGAASVLIARYVFLWQGGDREALLRLWHKANKVIGLLMLPAGLLLIAMAPDLIALAFGPNYDGAVVPFRIFSLLVAIRVANIGALIQAFGETRALLRITLTVLSLNLILNVPLTWLMGTAGTATATLLATLAGAMLTYRLVAMKLDVPFGQTAPFKSLGKIALLASFSASMAWLARQLIFPEEFSPAWTVALMTILHTSIYLPLGVRLGIVRREDFGYLRMLIRSSR